MTIDLISTGLVQGLILSIVAYGVMIPFRFLNFPDLTAEGAYPLGAVVCAWALSFGCSPLLSITLGMLASGIMGLMTALIHLKLQVNTLLSGIILSTMVYSVNLRIMEKPNMPLFDYASLFHNNVWGNMLILAGIIGLCIIPLALFLRTDFGLKLRVVGLNPDFASKQGISIKRYTLLGLFLAGSMFGLAGGLIGQMQSYVDVGMGVGIVIHGLASLMIGEAMIGRNTLNKQLLAPLLGALIYQQIQGLALSIGLAPSDLKFFTGMIVLFVIAMQKRERVYS